MKPIRPLSFAIWHICLFIIQIVIGSTLGRHGVGFGAMLCVTASVAAIQIAGGRYLCS